MASQCAVQPPALTPQQGAERGGVARLVVDSDAQWS